ncbi:hypothetical protein HanRHA438_Chr15g0706781 [Helianthus annuus]|uniref:Uncharacterized protein n=1 Tax=Helianthus annuus TaxID=4232 RepID=A0A9K3H358_HELAN|nr:hypothetical protein HanXRQr2_Chr15g0694361 [Helianthus annuus]KAJ0451289.1 hypothetical protein HanHA300_Chr15g0565871 [Helianthus annuus]KAJ0455760.1 hypothetical protein HanIR_Chr15g0754761 [Helianthus annuus]KAJ0473158.1 hypothetical protein HanHA89_Chr15g0615151 [Helianthus annuus]KAJ0652568.1 hypothetical protein HanOQP8_Chr15g0573621 [Helianthus annuus]
MVPRNSGSRDVYGNPVTAESRRRQWRQGSGGSCANRPLHLRYVRFSQVRLRFRRHGSTRFGSVQVLLGSDVVRVSQRVNNSTVQGIASQFTVQAVYWMLRKFMIGRVCDLRFC